MNSNNVLVDKESLSLLQAIFTKTPIYNWAHDRHSKMISYAEGDLKIVYSSQSGDSFHKGGPDTLSFDIFKNAIICRCQTSNSEFVRAFLDGVAKLKAKERDAELIIIYEKLGLTYVPA